MYWEFIRHYRKISYTNRSQKLKIAKIVYIGMKIDKKKVVSKLSSPLNNPKKVRCHGCKKFFTLTFVIPKWDYSKKNNLDYWTEREEDKGKYKCNSCLLDLYYNHKQDYWKLVTSPQKRQKMRTYIYQENISN